MSDPEYTEAPVKRDMPPENAEWASDLITRLMRSTEALASEVRETRRMVMGGVAR